MIFHDEDEDKCTMSFHHEEEDEDEEEEDEEEDDDDDSMDVRTEVGEIFREDDVERFVSTINREFKEKGKLTRYKSVEWPESDVLYFACTMGALKCAAAILDGETPLKKIDLNTPDEDGCYALHCAASNANAKAIGFLLSRGARTDIRGHCYSTVENLKDELPLPLQITLKNICSGLELKSWNQDPYVYERTSMSFCKQPKQQSVFMLVTILCLPRMEGRLSKLRLLAWSTKETEELFLEFVRRGEVIKVAALLGVAHKMLMSKDVLSDVVKKAAVPPVQQLFDVFERGGDAIDEYRKQKKNGESIEQTVDFVAKLLERSGIVVDSEDIDVTIYRWARYFMAKEWDYGTSLWNYGRPDGTQSKLKHTGERPFFLKPGKRFDYDRLDPRWPPRHLDEKEDMLKMKRKIGEGTMGDALATLSSGINNIWTRTRPSSRSQGSSTMSFTKPKLPLVPFLSSSFSSKPWMPSRPGKWVPMGKFILGTNGLGKFIHG